MIALPTMRNVAGYDFVVSTVDGTKHANLQVKTSLKRVSFFPMHSNDSVRCGPRDWYVLLRWLPRENRFEGFMLSGRETRQAVEDEKRRQETSIKKRTRKQFFPSINLRGAADSVDKWRERWLNWSL